MDFSESNGNKYRVDSERNTASKSKMGRKELCCAQLFGAFLFIVGLAGGLLIGIFVYHGGPDAEVSCKVSYLLYTSFNYIGC